MAHVDDQRVARVLDALEAQHPGAQLLVNDPWSIYYLTGFYADMFERFCGVLLARGSEPVILVNALHQLPEYDNARVAYHTDTDVVTDAIVREVNPAKPIGIDTVMRSGFLMPLMDRHAASEFFLGDFAVTAARTHKDAAEQELMRASSAANDAVMADAIKLVHEGVTEREIADQMLGLYRNHGCEGFSFPPIVSFGANAGDPHHEPDGTVLKRGDVALFDIGGRYRNYCSDMTRTFFWGEPDEETARIYDIVRRANEAAEALIAPGVRMCDLDRAARDVIEDAGYGQYFTHRLGHSIGLQDHEPGDVSLVNEQVVEPGMTFSIEPGIYPHYSLKWATDKFRWRAFGALPTIRASPEGPPIGRLRMAVCPCPVEGPGGVATGGARRSGRLIGNCRAQAPRPGNVGVAGRGSDRPTDWRITPWHHLECRKPSSGSMSGNCPIGHASRPGTARYC